MGILKIARMGHPALSGTAAIVDDPTSSAVQKLVADMIETMLDASGAGLAAPQVHVPSRVVVFFNPDDKENEPNEELTVNVLINPIIENLSDEMEDGVEGCLSIPGMAGIVPRYKHIRYSGIDNHGKKIEREVTGFHARVIQHECDHLDGFLYPMQMRDLSSFGFVEEIQKRSAADND